MRLEYGVQMAKGRDSKGKFAAGNPGKPRGVKHRATLAVEKLLEGEAEGLTRKAIKLALDGDTTALRLCLERLAPAPKDGPVSFALPKIEAAADASVAAAAIVAAVASGELTPNEGAHVMQLVETCRRTLETTDLEERLANLEAKA